MASIGKAFAKQRDFGLAARPTNKLASQKTALKLVVSEDDGGELAKINPRLHQLLLKRLRQSRYRLQRHQSLLGSTYESPLRRIASPMSPKNAESREHARPHEEHQWDGKGTVVEPRSSHKFYCYPDTTVKLYWDTFVAVLVIYTCLMVPYRIGFAAEASSAWEAFESLVNYVFMADILVTFRTPYADSRGVLVSSPWRIASRYIRGNFLVDLSSSLPFDAILGNSTASLGRSVMLLRALRLTRLLRLFRVTKIRRILEDNQSAWALNNTNYSRSIRIAITLFIMAHLLGSTWHGMSLLKKDMAKTWIAVLIAANNKNVVIKIATKYISSVYFAFTTMTTVGYGDILPITDYERLCAIAMMLFGGMIFGFVVGNVTAIIQNFNPVETHYREKMQEVKAYMRNRRIPRHLFRRIKVYFEHHYQDSSMLGNHQDILNKLTGPVAMQLNFVVYDNMIRRIPFLHFQRPAVAIAVAQVLKPFQIFLNEVLYYQGDLGLSFYFVGRGQLSTYVTLEPEARQTDPPLVVGFSTVPQESFTGEVSLFVLKGSGSID